MPRTIATSFLNSMQASNSDDIPILFVTLTGSPFGVLRLNSDNADYIYNGNLFSGVSLDVQIVSDDDQPPRAQIVFMNINRVVSDDVLGLVDSPVVKIELLSSADFNLAANPRTQIGTPTVEYTADLLRLSNVMADALSVTATLISWDFTSEPYPGITGTQRRLPGLFR